jgi:hypothetical protein
VRGSRIRAAWVGGTRIRAAWVRGSRNRDAWKRGSRIRDAWVGQILIENKSSGSTKLVKEPHGIIIIKCPYVFQ